MRNLHADMQDATDGMRNVTNKLGRLRSYQAPTNTVLHNVRCWLMSKPSSGFTRWPLPQALRSHPRGEGWGEPRGQASSPWSMRPLMMAELESEVPTDESRAP